jgi:hypothetical protein
MSGAMGSGPQGLSTIQRRAGGGVAVTTAFTAALAAALLLLAGCAPPSGSGGASSRESAAGQDTSAADATPDPLANMVSAVSPADTSAPLAVKFRIEARPVVGTPVAIMLALIPNADAKIGHIHGAFAAGDGLTLQSERDFDLDTVQGGTAVFREVTVVPRQTGVLNLSATFLLQTDQSTQTRTYSIPLIASDNSTS